MDTQITETVPTQNEEQKVETSKSKKRFAQKGCIVGCLIVVFVLFVIFIILIFLSNKIIKTFDLQYKAGNDQSETSISAEVQDESTKSAEDIEESTGSAEDLNQDTESEAGDTWKTYTNETLGFSLKIPLVSETSSGSCVWSESDGDHSYRPKEGIVPLKIFEDLTNNTVYLSIEYFYELGGKTTEDSHTYFSQCDKVTNSLAELKSTDSAIDAWEIVGAEVANDTELTAFIKEQYGSGCSLGAKTETEQSGVFDVTVSSGEADSLDEQIVVDCELNYICVLKYYPSANKVISWGVGQSANFFSSYPYESLDNEIIDSFKFLEGK